MRAGLQEVVTVGALDRFDAVRTDQDDLELVRPTAILLLGSPIGGCSLVGIVELLLVEQTLFAVSGMVVVVGLSGLVAVILAGLAERRRELAILRSVGARPRDVFLMLTLEGLAMTVLGIFLGVALLDLATVLCAPLIQSHYGLAIEPTLLAPDELPLLGSVIGIGLLACLIPGYRAYKLSLADGLTPRL